MIREILLADIFNCVVCCADLLRMMIWLVPARSENLNVNVPPYLNAETTVLQDLNDTGYFQVSFQILPMTHEDTFDCKLMQRSAACA